MSSIVIFVVLAAVVACGALFMWGSNAQSSNAKALNRASDLEKRLTSTQEELSGLREDVRKKTAQLEEARDRAQKAKKKGEREQQKALPAPAQTGPDQVALSRFAAAVEAAERKAAAAEKNVEARMEAAKEEARKEAAHEAAELRRKLQKAEEKLAAATQQEQEKPERDGERKAEVPAARIEVAHLAPEVVAELRRYYKRASNAEKLNVVAEGQLELIQDKLEEMQRRYYAVCRELALAALNKDKPQDMSDAEAARLAHDMVAASEEASRRRATKPRGGRPAPRQERERPAPKQRQAPQEGKPAAEGGDEAGRAERPRRERRRQFHRHPDQPATDGQEGGTEGAAPQEGARAEPATVSTASPPAEGRPVAEEHKEAGEPPRVEPVNSQG